MDAMQQVVNLIGQDEFISLLMELPDAYFALGQGEKDRVWQELLKACNRGTPIADLAKVAEVFVKVLIPME